MEMIPRSVRAVRFGPFEVDLRAGELRKQDRRIRLPDQPLHILTVLLEHPGEMVTREELRQRLWPADTFVDFDHGLNNAINRLREALGDSADHPTYIETIPRRGYRFIGTIERAAGVVPEASPTEARPIRSIAVLPLETVTRDPEYLGEERAPFSRHQAVNPEALALYPRAQSHSGLRRREDNQAAIRLLEKAIALDPSFATAHAALSAAYRVRGLTLEPDETEWEEKAFAAVQKALQLDANLAEAYAARGFLLWSRTNHFPHARAVRELRRALALNPNLAEAHHQLGNVYNHVGLLDKA